MKFEEALVSLSEQAKESIKDCKTAEDVFQLFKQNNIDISLDEIKNALQSFNGELSDDELENVTGGNIIQDIIQGIIGHYAKLLINDQKVK